MICLGERQQSPVVFLSAGRDSDQLNSREEISKLSNCVQVVQRAFISRCPCWVGLFSDAAAFESFLLSQVTITYIPISNPNKNSMVH